MTTMVLLCGATGALGRPLLAALRSRGYRVRALCRDRARSDGLGADEVWIGDANVPASLAGAFAGVGVVVSALGGSVRPQLRRRECFDEQDFVTNRNILDGACAAGVPRMLYVSMLGAGSIDLALPRAHARVEDAIAASGIDHVIVRPTGFFSSLEMLLSFAALGAIIESGGGTVRTNPIHEEDLAEACVDALTGDRRIVEVGGPDVLTRRQIAEMAFAAVGKKPRVLDVPHALARLGARVVRALHPRLGEVFRFYDELLSRDFVAPRTGRRHLADYFRERAVDLHAGTATGAPMVADAL